MNTIVCVDSNWGIGRDNDLLYHIPADMKYFREKTTGKTVVMGLATLKSFPGSKPLKNRTNIVLCDDDTFECEGIIKVSSLDELFETLRDYDSDDVFVIGGASVYRQLLPYCSTAYITKVEAVEPADKYFVNLDEEENWSVEEQSEEYTHENLNFRFNTYKNSNPLSYAKEM